MWRGTRASASAGVTRYGGGVNRYDRRIWALAAGLSGLAGFVDALGFLELGGFFVSFMSGNSTRLSIGLVEGVAAAGVAGGLIATFVAGVLAGSLAGHAARHHRRAAVLALVAALLAAAAGIAAAGVAAWPIALMAFAMGAENAVFERDGEVEIGLTYMTGTLVKLGQRLALVARGGPRFAWLPYLLLWLGLVVGAAGGALAHAALGLGALWIAAAAAAGLALIAARFS